MKRSEGSFKRQWVVAAKPRTVVGSASRDPSFPLRGKSKGRVSRQRVNQQSMTRFRGFFYLLLVLGFGCWVLCRLPARVDGLDLAHTDGEN